MEFRLSKLQAMQTQPSVFLKFQTISELFTMEFRFTETKYYRILHKISAVQWIRFLFTSINDLPLIFINSILNILKVLFLKFSIIYNKRRFICRVSAVSQFLALGIYYNNLVFFTIFLHVAIIKQIFGKLPERLASVSWKASTQNVSLEKISEQLFFRYKRTKEQTTILLENVMSW